MFIVHTARGKSVEITHFTDFNAAMNDVRFAWSIPTVTRVEVWNDENTIVYLAELVNGCVVKRSI